MGFDLEAACKGLEAKFAECLDDDDVETALTALRDAMRGAIMIERAGRGVYQSLPDHRTRAWAASVFLKIVGLVQPKKVRVSGHVGVVHTTAQDLIAQASGIRLERAAEIVREYLPEAARTLEHTQPAVLEEVLED